MLYRLFILIVMAHPLNAEPNTCSSYRLMQCYEWHYCDVNNSECRPCNECGPGDKPSTGRDSNCSAPVECTGDYTVRHCPTLYHIHEPHASYRQVLGTQLTTDCSIDGAAHTVQLRCGWNGTDEEWSGNGLECFSYDVLPTPPPSGTPQSARTKILTITLPTVVAISLSLGVISIAWCRIKRKRTDSNSQTEPTVFCGTSPTGETTVVISEPNVRDVYRAFIGCAGSSTESSSVSSVHTLDKEANNDAQTHTEHFPFSDRARTPYPTPVAEDQDQDRPTSFVHSPGQPVENSDISQVSMSGTRLPIQATDGGNSQCAFLQRRSYTGILDNRPYHPRHSLDIEGPSMIIRAHIGGESDREEVTEPKQIYTPDTNYKTVHSLEHSEELAVLDETHVKQVLDTGEQNPPSFRTDPSGRQASYPHVSGPCSMQSDLGGDVSKQSCSSQTVAKTGHMSAVEHECSISSYGVSDNVAGVSDHIASLGDRTSSFDELALESGTLGMTPVSIIQRQPEENSDIFPSAETTSSYRSSYINLLSTGRQGIESFFLESGVELDPSSMGSML